jgi:hypothetical protein
LTKQDKLDERSKEMRAMRKSSEHVRRLSQHFFRRPFLQLFSMIAAPFARITSQV